jgi:hypothetical protein
MAMTKSFQRLELNFYVLKNSLGSPPQCTIIIDIAVEKKQVSMMKKILIQ